MSVDARLVKGASIDAVRRSDEAWWEESCGIRGDGSVLDVASPSLNVQPVPNVCERTTVPCSSRPPIEEDSYV